MALAAVTLNEEHQQLMLAIGEAIRDHTTHTPMTTEAIVGVLGFCAGAAIVRGVNDRSYRKKLRDIAQANVDNGMDAMQRAVSGSSLILPSTVQ